MERLELPELITLPAEIWAIIITSLKVAPRYGVSAHIDAGPYWVLVRTESKFGKLINSAPMTFARKYTTKVEEITLLPNGDRHSINDQPAVVRADMSEWWHYGKLHRDGSPAVIGDAIEKWYFNDLRHRVGGPAVTYTRGSIEYFQHGQWHRDDGPAITDDDGTEIWFQHGVIHRDYTGAALPAVISGRGRVMKYYQHGVLHREDGPAVNYAGRFRHWWVHGVFQTSETFTETPEDTSAQYYNSHIMTNLYIDGVSRIV